MLLNFMFEGERREEGGERGTEFDNFSSLFQMYKLNAP
jgi:hypothetical protein